MHSEILELKAQLSTFTNQVGKLVEKLGGPEPTESPNGNTGPCTDIRTPATDQQADTETATDKQTETAANQAKDDGQPEKYQATTIPTKPSDIADSNRQPGPQKPEPKKKTAPLNWETVVKSGRKTLPQELQTRAQASMLSLNTSGFQARRFRQCPTATAHPKPVAVYFANIPRGPIGALKKALLECLLKWAILGISFIGAEVTEILCHVALLDRLIATLQFFRYKHLPTYNPTKVATEGAPTDTQRTYRAACYRRWKRLGDQTPSPICKTWYTSSAADLLESDPGLDKVDTPKRRENQ